MKSNDPLMFKFFFLLIKKKKFPQISAHEEPSLKRRTRSTLKTCTAVPQIEKVETKKTEIEVSEKTPTSFVTQAESIEEAKLSVAAQVENTESEKVERKNTESEKVERKNTESEKVKRQNSDKVRISVCALSEVQNADQTKANSVGEGRRTR